MRFPAALHGSFYTGFLMWREAPVKAQMFFLMSTISTAAMTQHGLTLPIRRSTEGRRR